MDKMSMVLVVQYDSETLCSDEELISWFHNRGLNDDEGVINIDGLELMWNNMKSVNSLIFTVNIIEDNEFPPVLFDYIRSLENKNTIISLAEESNSGYQLIFESNLEKFKKEILSE
tara:strand:+ start:2205 stop:2552 length:348 start_codon:yes stop_codon:yes gene_type:complete